LEKPNKTEWVLGSKPNGLQAVATKKETDGKPINGDNSTVKSEAIERWFGPRAPVDLLALVLVVVGKSHGRAEALSEVKQCPPAIVSLP
jgi:hypothetical protein